MNVPPSALDNIETIIEKCQGKRVLVFLDYDGTLSPIVARPELAILTPEMRVGLEGLAAKCTVAIISGRDRPDVEKLVQVPDMIFAGSHGFDIKGPGVEKQQDEGSKFLPDLDAAEKELRAATSAIEGSLIERKKYAIAIHYRLVAEDKLPEIEAAVKASHEKHPSLRIKGGKKIFELQPDVDWDKGKAIHYLMNLLYPGADDLILFFLGDDLTDEDAFRALNDNKTGMGIRVIDEPAETVAAYSLKNTDEVGKFMQEMTNRL
ncbi:MAG: trehalose-phosphatase [Deltaproteobacteria bacterium]|jgi:trehalose-phosphatase|nr:trehalose-phosphatase [Deltaproteobacteria bacterium]